MNKQKTLIFFGAHPDDETFGMGATLAQYASSGVKVYYVCSTRGEAGTVDPEFMQGYKNNRRPAHRGNGLCRQGPGLIRRYLFGLPRLRHDRLSG